MASPTMVAIEQIRAMCVAVNRKLGGSLAGLLALKLCWQHDLSTYVALRVKS